MIKTDFPECCQECPHVDIKIDSSEYQYINQRLPVKDIEIYCRNRDICYKGHGIKDETIRT